MRKKGKTRKIFIGSVLLAGLVLLFVWWYSQQQPPVTPTTVRQFAAGVSVEYPQPGIVQVQGLPHVARLTVADPEGVQQLQVFLDDSSILQTGPLTAEDTTVTAAYTPTQQTHILFAEIIDADGQRHTSQAIRFYTQPEAIGDRFVPTSDGNYRLVTQPLPERQAVTQDEVVRTTVQQCDITIDATAHDWSAGEQLTVSALPPGTLTWQERAVISAEDPRFTEIVTAGTHSYLLQNADTAITKTVVVTTADCPVAEWQGAAVTDGSITVEQPVESAVVYWQQGATWTRFPAVSGQQLPVNDGTVDVQPYLEQLVAADGGAAFEVWSAVDGSMQQVAKGSTDTPVSTQWYGGALSGATQLWAGIALNTDVETLLDTITVTAQDAKAKFKWRTAAAADGGIVEVAMVPFPSNSLAEPTAIIHSQTVTGKSGIFTVDFKNFIVDDGQPRGDWPPLRRILEPGVYYVRVVPTADGQVVGMPSRAIPVNYQQESDQPPVRFYDFELYTAKIVDYQPAVFPRGDRFRCVEVIANNFPNNSSLKAAWNYSPGDILCPKSYKGGSPKGFEALWEDVKGFVADAIDAVSSAYAAIKNGIVSIAGSAVCQFGSSDVKDACQAALSVAADIGMAYVGVPPSLPNFDQLVELGKGEVATLAIDEVSRQTGVPCVGPCAEAIRQAVNEGFDQLANTSINPSCVGIAEAHRYGQEPLCLPEQIVVRPAPGAEFTPPVVQVTITRKTDTDATPAPDWAGCSVAASLQVTNTFAGGYVSGTWGQHYVAAQELRGKPFAGGATPIPTTLAPGESITVPVVLGQPQPYYLAGNAPDPRSQLPPKHDDWYRLYYGGQGVVSVSGAGRYCAFSDSRSVTLPNQ